MVSNFSALTDARRRMRMLVPPADEVSGRKASLGQGLSCWHRYLTHGEWPGRVDVMNRVIVISRRWAATRAAVESRVYFHQFVRDRPSLYLRNCCSNCCRLIIWIASFIATVAESR